MSLAAFYLEHGEWSAKPVLTGQELAHMHVLRLRDGEQIELFDGQGKTAICRIEHLDRKLAQLEIESVEEYPAPVSRPILALALSKAVRRGFFMEKAAELGAWQIWLWHAERSQGRLAPNLVESCRMQLVAGLKQSRNPWLPVLRTGRDAASIIELGHDIFRKLLPWEQKAGMSPISLAQLGQAGETLYVIGPEGGFSEKEASLFISNGFMPASLGKRVLRCETAATLCLALHWWASQLADDNGQSAAS